MYQDWLKYIYCLHLQGKPSGSNQKQQPPEQPQNESPPLSLKQPTPDKQNLDSSPSSSSTSPSLDRPIPPPAPLGNKQEADGLHTTVIHILAVKCLSLSLSLRSSYYDLCVVGPLVYLAQMVFCLVIDTPTLRHYIFS